MTRKSNTQTKQSRNNHGGSTRVGVSASRSSSRTERNADLGGRPDDRFDSNDQGRDSSGQFRSADQGWDSGAPDRSASSRDSQNSGDHRHHYNRGYQDGFRASRDGMRDHLDSDYSGDRDYRGAGSSMDDVRGRGENGDYWNSPQQSGRNVRDDTRSSGRSQPLGGYRGDSRGQDDTSYRNEPGNYGSGQQNASRGNQNRSASRDSSGSQFGTDTISQRDFDAGTETRSFNGGTADWDRANDGRESDTTRFAAAGQQGRSAPARNGGSVRAKSSSSRKSGSRK